MEPAELGFASAPPDVAVPIRGAGLGARFGERTFDLTARRVMAFAAGIGADDPRYLDDAAPGGIVAPPGIVACFEWPVFLTDDYLRAIGREPANALNGLVHAAQASRFHRPVRPGDRLATAARIVAMRGTRAGVLVTTRIDTVEADGGAPVANGWFAIMYRGAALEGEGGAVEEVPAPGEEAGLAAPAVVLEIPVPRWQAHVYTECADIWNPIHTERAYALASGLPDIVLHGSCTFAMTLERLAATFAPGEPLPFRRFSARFRAPVIPGAAIRVEAAAPAAGRIAFEVRDAAGRLVLSHGIAERAR